MYRTALTVIIGACVLVSGPAQKQAGPSIEGHESKLSLAKPFQIGTIAVVPIISRSPLAEHKYITLAEASRLGLVEVVEVPGRETVNTLEVRNKSHLPLILFAGELLLGGKQDRIVAKDTVVPPRNKRPVPVFCVEHGRWSGRGMSFSQGHGFVPDHVRQTASQTSSQSAVWGAVSTTNAAAGAASSTGSIQATLNDPKVKKAVEELAKKLAAAFEGSKNAVGVICWLNGEVFSADIFANPALFAASRDMLLQSYCVDAQLIKGPKKTPVNMKECRKFLNDIVAARRELSERGMTGALYRIKDGKVAGYEFGRSGFGGGFGGGGFGHGSYKQGGGGG